MSLNYPNWGNSEELRIIHKALIDENETFYALCSNSCTLDSHKHIHFKCTSCQTVTCVQADKPIHLSIPDHSVEHFEVEATGRVGIKGRWVCDSFFVVSVIIKNSSLADKNSLITLG